MKFTLSKKLFFIAFIFNWGTLSGAALVGIGLYLLSEPPQAPLLPGATSIVGQMGKAPLLLGVGFGVGLLLYSIRSAIAMSATFIGEGKEAK